MGRRALSARGGGQEPKATVAGRHLLKAKEPGGQQGFTQEKIRGLADEYAGKRGKTLNHDLGHIKADPVFGKKVADAYESMKHDPRHPEVRQAYGALHHETQQQLEHLLDNGLKITPIPEGQMSPYKTSKDLFRDLHENGHIHYFPTSSGFGNGETDHPLLNPMKLKNGAVLPANDALRLVHDLYGHAKGGAGFGPNGEEQAYHSHAQMYSPLAQKALASETRGQNSWVNFSSKVGELNRKDPANTVFADQKAGILPDWTRKTQV
jgi:hypothetical protein